MKNTHTHTLTQKHEQFFFEKMCHYKDMFNKWILYIKMKEKKAKQNKTHEFTIHKMRHITSRDDLIAAKRIIPHFVKICC